MVVLGHMTQQNNMPVAEFAFLLNQTIVKERLVILEEINQILVDYFCSIGSGVGIMKRHKRPFTKFN